MLCPTPVERLTDPQGRLTFLWDVEMTWDDLRAKLADPDPAVRAYWVGKVMRQAKPDDALTYLTPAQMAEAWPLLRGRLGRMSSFWAWWMGRHGF